MSDSWIVSRLRTALSSQSVKGILMIGGGTAVGQVLMVLATPILARLYQPEAYGALAVYSGIMAVAASIVSFRYECAIPLPHEDGEADDILRLAVGATVVCTILTCLGVMVWQVWPRPHPPSLLLRVLAWAIPAGMFLLGSYETLGYWAIRKQDYKALSVTKVSQTVASLGLQFSCFRFVPQGVVLIIAYVVGQAFGIRSLFHHYLASRPRGRSAGAFARIRQVAVKYWPMSFFGLLTTFLTRAGDNLPAFLLARAFGLKAAGIYLMASRVFALPAAVVGNAMAQVFTAEASKRMRQDPARVLTYFRTMHRSLLWVAAGLLLIGFACPWVLPWILGPQWKAAGVTAAILAPMAAADITVRPLFNITLIGNRPRFQLFTGLIYAGLCLAGLGVPILLHCREITTLAVFAACRVVASGLIFLAYLHVATTIQGPEGQDSGADPKDLAAQGQG